MPIRLFTGLLFLKGLCQWCGVLKEKSDCESQTTECQNLAYRPNLVQFNFGSVGIILSDDNSCCEFSHHFFATGKAHFDVADK